jgi:hypothetical protein
MSDMPHMCTKCGKVYEEASEVLLHGCPECGWNKFLYLRSKEEAEKVTVAEYVKKKEKEWRTKVEEEMKKGEEIPPEGKVVELKGLSPDDVESIRIVEPGRYELNLNALFEREEIIMALRGNGTYIIHLPSIFKKKLEGENSLK